MNSCVIFGAAGFDGLIEPIGKGDWCIAADGGLRHTQALGISPQETLGDFDSLGFVPENAEVFPVEKDDTDTMLAIKRGLALGYRRFVIYGGMDGERTDHTMANFQALSFLAQREALGFLVGSRTIAAALKRGCLRFPADAEGELSVFCVGAEAAEVSLTGLHYSGERFHLTADFPLGASNHFVGKPAAVAAISGQLLVMWRRGNSLPKWEA